MAITLNGSTGITTDIDGDESLTLNRNTSDGEIITFKKEDTTAGSIITNGNAIGIGSSEVGLFFYYSGPNSNILPYDIGNNTLYDNVISLGNSSNRFKDLYLSGGAYVGGTGSANYLDDYETGTWTPTYYRDGDSPTSSTTVGLYTKIGNRVIISGGLSGLDITNVGYLRMSNFPFTPSQTNNASGNGTAVARYTQAGGTPYSIHISSSAAYVFHSATNAGNYVQDYVDGETIIYFTAMYHTAA